MVTKIMYSDECEINNEAIKIAANIIREGGTVVFPTETVYGLGANALSEEAVNSIFTAKGRPSDNPLIVHVSNIDMLIYIIGEPLTDRARLLIDKYWPGPLTLIFKKSKNVAKVVTAGLDTVAVRMPDNEIALHLIAESGVPIAAPSANISGKPSPTQAQHVIDDLDERVDMILCGQKSRVGVESTVLDISGQVPMILRPGGITAEELREVLGQVEIDAALTDTDKAPKAPGMKYTHYAPNAEMLIVKGEMKKVVEKIQHLLEKSKKENKKAAVLATDETMDYYKDCNVVSMGRRGDSTQAAHGIFAALRQFDNMEIDIIYAEAVDEKHLGLAVMNRMKKAAGYKIIEV